jgi:hypothetical protein
VANSLLILGPFSFTGLESPERIHLKSKQRLAIHHLTSGQSISDCLGEAYEIVTFRGIFSGIDATERIRLIDALRADGLPLTLTWGSTALTVIIQELELDYSSELWVPYRLSCYAVHLTDSSMNIYNDIISQSPIAQVNDVLNLMQSSGVILTSDHSAAIVALATCNYDQPLIEALGKTYELVSLIDNRLAVIGNGPVQNSSVSSALLGGDSFKLADLAISYGLQATLILARNRLINVIVRAEGVTLR